MPESPTWLSERGRQKESAAVLSRIYAKEEDLNIEVPSSSNASATEPIRPSLVKGRRQQAAYEFISPVALVNDKTEVNKNHHLSSDYSVMGEEETIAATVVDGRNASLTSVTGRVCVWGQNLVSSFTSAMKHHPRQAYIAMFLSVTQQLCGQTCVLSFAPHIFASVVESDGNAESFVGGWTTVSIGMVKFIVTIIVIWKIEAVGRRPLLLSGLVTIALGLFMLLVSSGMRGSSVAEVFASSQNTENADGGATHNNSEENSISIGLLFAIAGVMLVVCGYSMSFGPLTWLLTSELFPTDVRGRALGASTVLTFIAAIFVTSTFLELQSALGSAFLFGCYLLVSVVGLVFVLIAVPETKGKTVEQIDKDLGRMVWWRRSNATW